MDRKKNQAEPQRSVRDELLYQIAGLEGTPTGSFNIRRDGEMDGRASTEHIRITGTAT